MSRLFHAVALASCLTLSGAARAQDWNTFADIEAIQIVTNDDDGKPRDTKVWLAVHDGNGYVRTGGTRWGDNVRRDSNVVVRIGTESFPLHAVAIPSEDPLYASVADSFRQKYGFSDRAMGILRNLGGPAMILRLDPR